MVAQLGRPARERCLVVLDWPSGGDEERPSAAAPAARALLRGCARPHLQRPVRARGSAGPGGCPDRHLRRHGQRDRPAGSRPLDQHLQGAGVAVPLLGQSRRGQYRWLPVHAESGPLPGAVSLQRAHGGSAARRVAWARAWPWTELVRPQCGPLHARIPDAPNGGPGVAGPARRPDERHQTARLVQLALRRRAEPPGDGDGQDHEDSGSVATLMVR
jgi:hypothetical protein